MSYHRFYDAVTNLLAFHFPASAITSSPFDGGRLRWGCRKEGVCHTPLHMTDLIMKQPSPCLLPLRVGEGKIKTSRCKNITVY
jgi:hypothetical protein